MTSILLLAGAAQGASVAFGSAVGNAAPDVTDLSLSVDPSITSPGVATVALTDIPFSSIPARTPATQTAPIGKSPIGKSPIGKSPIGKSPIGKSPIGKSPIGKSPIGKSPLLDESLASFPFLREGGWPVVLAHTCRFSNRDHATCRPTSVANETSTAAPQSVTWAELLRDPFATDGDPATLPELDPSSPQAIRLDEILWSLSPIRDVTFLSFLMGSVTWNEVSPPSGGWCAQWTAVGTGCSASDLDRTIFDSEAGGLPVDLTSLPDRRLADVTDLSRTLFWSSTIIDTNIVGSALGDIRFSDVANLPAVVDCSGGYCNDGDARLRSAATDGRITDSGTFADLGGSALGPLALSAIEYAFLDAAAVDWEGAPLAAIGFETLPTGSPATFVRYTLGYTISCSSSTGMTARVDLPEGFRYRPGSSRIDADPLVPGDAALTDPVVDPPSDRDGVLVWDLSPFGCSSGSASFSVSFQAMPGFRAGTFTSDATIVTGSTSATLSGTAPITVTGGLQGTTIGSPATARAGSLSIGHIVSAGDRGYVSFTADPGHEVIVTLSHLRQNYDLVLYAPDGSQEAEALRSTPPEPVPFGKAPATDPGAGDATTLPPEALQDVPIEPGKVVAGVSALRGTEQESISVTAVAGNGGSSIYIAQITGNNGAHGPEPYVLTIRTTGPQTLPPCRPREFPFAQAPPPGPPVQPPVVGEQTDTLILVDSPRLTAAFGPQDAAEILQRLTELQNPSLGFTAQIVDLSLFPSVNEAFARADANPCSPQTNNAVVRAINDAVDGLKGPLNGNLAGLKWLTIVGDDDLIPHARIPDLTTEGNERGFAGDTFFADPATGEVRTNQLGGAFGNGYFLSDAPYGSFRPLSILGQTVYPMQVAVGRLGGSASTITSAIQLFLATGGVADPRSATTDPRLGLVTDYDFATDGGDRIADNLAGASVQVARLSGPWTKDELASALAGGGQAPHLISPNAHYDQYRLLPGAGDAGTWTEDDLFTTRDVQNLAGDAFRLRVLFGIGCHFGLGFPDRLAGSDPTARDADRVLDWQQVYVDRGAAALIGSLGYGYGDTSAVGFSEQLMANLAANLVDAPTIGEALTAAEEDYLLSMGSFSPYDAKTVEQTILWGLPMYRLPQSGTGESNAATAQSGIGPSAAEIEVNIRPALEKVTIGGRSYYRASAADVTCSLSGCGAEPDEGVQVTHPYPIMPRVVTGLPAVPGATAKGAIMLGVPLGDAISPSTPRTEVAEEPIDIAFANATIDSSSIEPAPSVDTIYPTTPQSLTTFLGQDGGTTQRLVVLPGQFRSGTDGSHPERGTFRAFTASRWLVTYSSDTTDTVPPQILQVDGNAMGGQTEFTVTVADPGNPDPQPVARVVVDALPLGGSDPNVYRMLDLQPDPADPARWVGTMPFNVREFVVFAIDTHGHTAGATNGGAAYAARDETAPDIASAVGAPNVTGADGTTYVRATTPVTITVADAGSGVAACTIDVLGPVTASPPCAAGDNTFTLPATSGAYAIDVQAQDAVGNTSSHTFSLSVDETAPAIAITSPEAKAYELGQALTAAYACSDTGSGLDTCVGSATNGSSLSTSALGQQTFAVTSADRLGNHATKTVVYTIGYGTCLLYDPQQPFRLSTSTVPIKVMLCDKGFGGNLSSSSITLTGTKLVRVVNDQEVEVVLDANSGTGNTTFRFDVEVTTGGGYIYNLQTRNLARGSTYRLYFTVSGEPVLSDGSPVQHFAPFTTR